MSENAPNLVSTTSSAAGLAGVVEGPWLAAAGRPVPIPDRDRFVAVEQRGGVSQGLADAIADLDDEALELRGRELAGVISAAQAELALLLAEIDARGLPGRNECATLSRFTGWRMGLGSGQTRRLADLGRAMRSMPVLAEAVCDATVSVDKGVAVARAADVSSEAGLVALAAQTTVAQTERLTRQWRRLKETRPELIDDDGADPDDPEAPTAAELGYHPTVVVIRDDDGVELRARFDHADGELVLAGLDRFTDTERKARRDAAPADPARANPAWRPPPPGPDGRGSEAETARAGGDAPPALQPGGVDDHPAERLTREQWRGHGLLALFSAAETTESHPDTLQPNGFATQVVMHVDVDLLLDPVDGHCDDCGQPVDVVAPTHTTLLHPTSTSGEEPPPGASGQRPPREPGTSPPGPAERPRSAERPSPGAAPPTAATSTGSPPTPPASTGSPIRREPAPATSPPTAVPAGAEPAPLDDLSSFRPPGPMRELEPRGVHLRRDLARFLACDAGFLTVVDDADGNPLHLGPRTQTVTPTQRRAMSLRYRHCQWPGCTAARVDAHHRHHRADGGHDDVESLLPLCRYHHRQVHLRRITVTTDARGRPTFTRPDGSTIDAHPALPGGVADASEAAARLFERHVAAGADPLEPARRPRWLGDPLRLGDAVDAVISRQQRARRRTRAS
ncbi:HNH endonuclease signature motif containing protein [Rhabdothermincola salaria]|uniref:HNH endonuclease signature motif containing protein n=1 Tax=Rhabdothermincola salaria TaxID=2903142 RepID=UPI001E34DBD2|nr:HNH endonuclease signature motif containing protein [Rhabdothermincola salaria]MCD9624854.1 hypothetical protein [Rhabdothermincola salaria]